MWGCSWGYMGWWGPFFGLLWFVLLGLFVYWLVRTLAPERRGRALEVLRERYAKGEIDKETFEKGRARLWPPSLTAQETGSLPGRGTPAPLPVGV